MRPMTFAPMLGLVLAGGLTGCATPAEQDSTAAPAAAAGATAEARSPDGMRYLSQPLLRDIYIADPSAHVFNGRIYVYPSHDIESGVPDDDLGT